LHHIPSGILNPDVMNVVTTGVVLNPATILKEIDGLLARGIDVHQNLMLSERAHVVFPWHVAEDHAINQSNVGSGENIGTTLRGIGPCYRDKVGRTNAIRLGDMLRDDFLDRVRQIVEIKKKLFTGSNGAVELDAEAIHAEYASYVERLGPLVRNTTEYLLDAVEQGKRLLFEGAQGALLDIDHGTFPFVTSSNSSGVGVSCGSGVPGRWIDQVFGVIKTYSTRVGGGPFPTELDDEIGERIRQRGKEFGTTTGRPRRCGWFDAVAVRYTRRLSGVDGLAAMMLDVLSEFAEIKICVAYEIDGERTTRFPSQADELRRIKPIYETVPGWEEDITGIRDWVDLPPNAVAYLDRIAELVGCPVSIISVGPDRTQTIFVHEDGLAGTVAGANH
jgi:adenylosuccinate synthase